MTLVQKEVQKVYMWKEPYTDYSAMQGPCPSGFHVPTSTEWTDLKTILQYMVGTGSVMKTYLKMPFAGRRNYTNSNVLDQGNSGTYWCANRYNNTTGYYIYFNSSQTTVGSDFGLSFGLTIRAFKDKAVIPTSSWTKLYGTNIQTGGIYRSSAEGLISISNNGSTWTTIADKNLGATTVYNDGNALSQANCGYYYQRGNNHGFPFTGSVTTSSTKVNASSYGPGNYYSSSTFITGTSSSQYWDSSYNGDLWGAVTGPISGGGDIQIRPEQAKPRTPNEHTWAYRPLSSTTAGNDQSGNGRNLTASGGSYGEYQGVDCLYMGTASQYRVYSSFPNTTRENTFLVRVYIPNKSYNRTLLNFSNTSQTISVNTTPQLTYQYKNSSNSSTSKAVTLSNSLGIWTLVAITHSSNNATRTVYRINENETQKIEITNGYTGGLGTTWYIGNTSNANAGWRQGALSNVIVEDYARTEEEILNHYNTSKANYGIS